MRDVASDPAALELLRVQRARLADRLRPPWWYLAGVATMFALVFAFPFASRFLGVEHLALRRCRIGGGRPAAVWLDRVTGIKMGFRNLSSPGGPCRAVCGGRGEPWRHSDRASPDRSRPDRGVIAVAALAVAAEVALQRSFCVGMRSGAAGRRRARRDRSKPDPLIHP